MHETVESTEKGQLTQQGVDRGWSGASWKIQLEGLKAEQDTGWGWRMRTGRGHWWEGPSRQRTRLGACCCFSRVRLF